jgi:para-nitrobenzyl esterase
MLAALALAAALVQTEAGVVKGERITDGRSLFHGIPFAQPPVGALRWRPPAPVQPWPGIRDATRSGPGCMQIDYGWNHNDAAVQSEDCLYLEVGTPNLKPSKPLPVMVWIHGGGNRGGGARGTISSDLSKQVVLVSVQYRLGPLGFLSHPALTAESPLHASGNYALMDQQAALHWVQANIARFGGDPHNVTIFGESAGAQDVGLQQLSPLARGLFHKAIEESGTAGFGVPPRTLAQNEALGEAIVRAAGARDHPSADDLRRLPPRALVKAAEHTAVPGLSDATYIWLQAVVDGWVLRAAPAVTLAKGEQARVPLIIGTNARELERFGGKAKARDTIAWAWGRNAAQAQVFYDAVADPDPRRGDLGLQIATDFIFACPTGVIADAQSKARLPVWQYEFDYAPPGGKVSHSSEIPFVMNEPFHTPTGAPPLLTYWINFARTGNPNGAGLPAWPGYAPGKRFIEFGQGKTEVRSDLRAPICRLRAVP